MSNIITLYCSMQASLSPHINDFVYETTRLAVQKAFIYLEIGA